MLHPFQLGCTFAITNSNVWEITTFITLCCRSFVWICFLCFDSSHYINTYFFLVCLTGLKLKIDWYGVFFILRCKRRRLAEKCNNWPGDQADQQSAGAVLWLCRSGYVKRWSRVPASSSGYQRTTGLPSAQQDNTPSCREHVSHGYLQ